MDTFEKCLVGLVAGILLTIAVLIYIQCGKQAEFYTETTGIEMTRGDAFWLDLEPPVRVIQEVK